MKKLFGLIVVIAMISFGAVNNSYAQGGPALGVDDDNTKIDEGTKEYKDVKGEGEEKGACETEEEATGLLQAIKVKFVEGGPMFMAFVLLSLVLGLAVAIERIIYLNIATSNTRALLNKVEKVLQEGSIDDAKTVCRNARGPVASIFYQGLERYNSEDKNSLELVEKSIISYGSVQAGLLEKGLSWLALFIAVAPMLGFMGTVIGMIQAFDEIEKVGNISATIVAGGIKVALITTVSGLVVAIILQIFYNYIVSKIDGLVNRMEDASISFIDLIYKYNAK
jgi:biopolymer transport protein ExbB